MRTADDPMAVQKSFHIVDISADCAEVSVCQDIDVVLGPLGDAGDAMLSIVVPTLCYACPDLNKLPYPPYQWPLKILQCSLLSGCNFSYSGL